MRPQPRWLADKIAVNARKYGEAECSGCGAPVIAGLDGDLCALFVMLDAAPVDQLGELRNLMRGSTSFIVIDGEIHQRTGFAVTRYPIHLEHRCHGGTS